jgi:hypothetical protein
MSAKALIVKRERHGSMIAASCATKCIPFQVGWCCLVIVISASAQGAPQQQDAPSCRQFSQEFYDWYVPFTQKTLHMPAWK